MMEEMASPTPPGRGYGWRRGLPNPSKGGAMDGEEASPTPPKEGLWMEKIMLLDYDLIKNFKNGFDFK
ncbi:hypothetical protein [Ferruginibacter sp. HRS2-29]|uniref:hypothetical protein n=1 Tax=Ferruginibacter sp. HRS2-29 TaxID=2487334 RepID=UPI0020CBC99E|nr:hypothetical protein [Ferruginibacter sp. HRS2-29]MCP9753258.1 hypothetical protein [Ferruginibacter sp. HRS2-29]